MRCHLCNNNTLTEFLDLGQQPLANKYPKREEFEKEDFFPLKVLFCTTCKNVQLGTMVSRERMFEDYYYLSSVNLGLVRHFEALAEKIKDAKFVIDIGSNDGILLKPLKERGIKALGVEPSINVSKIANDAGLTTITTFFNSDSVAQIKTEHGEPDVVVASNMFTHLEDPHSFIEDVKKLMTKDGVFIVEVENIGHILDSIQFERFYLDRIFYYSLTSLKHLFELHGMYLEDAEKVEMHGVSIRAFVRNKEYGRGESKKVAEMLQAESRALTDETLGRFKQEVDTHVSAFRAKLEEYKRQGLRIGGYGAPARVATICNYGKIGPELISFIVDDSPLKQNRFSPGTHIPIVTKGFLDAQTQKPDVLVVFAFEYFEDIKKKLGENTYRFLFPIPPREVS